MFSREKPSCEPESQTNYSRGVEAEKHAEDYLRGRGYEIIKQRYKTKFGEIDIIARKGDMICFVEVKARKTKAAALESVTPRVQRRIEQSALFFLTEYPEYADFMMRFDVIAIAQPFEITHLDNAWEARS